MFPVGSCGRARKSLVNTAIISHYFTAIINQWCWVALRCSHGQVCTGRSK